MTEATSTPFEPAAHHEFEPGTLLAGKYRVEQVLGVGGMGVVVQATHEVLGDKVAVKFLLPELANNAHLKARFLREAQAAVRIKSPHVARVTDVGELESGSPYMVMEFLEGRDLAAMLDAEGPLPVRGAVAFILQACEAIASAHAAGVVHRDLKPSNLFVTQAPDGSPAIKVLDFGISKDTEAKGGGSLTQTQMSMGSPYYMSPEQIRSTRDVDGRTDIWALGIVLYELLTRTVPFESDSMPALCAAVLENDVPPIGDRRDDLPPGLEAAIRRCLEKDVAKRFQNVAELAIALAPFAGTLGRQSAGRSSRILGVVVPEDARESTVPGAITGAPRSRASVSSPDAFASTSLHDGDSPAGAASKPPRPSTSASPRPIDTSFGKTAGAVPPSTEARGGTRKLWIGLGAAALLGLATFAVLGGGGAAPAAEVAPTVEVAAVAPPAPPPVAAPEVTPEPTPSAPASAVVPVASAAAPVAPAPVAPKSAPSAKVAPRPAPSATAVAPTAAAPNPSLYDDRR